MRLADTFRRVVRSFASWRTVQMLEQVDADAQELRHARDTAIPAALRALAEEKQALLQQLASVTNADERHRLPIAVPRAPATGGWSPAAPGRTGPLFQQRTPKQ